MGYWCTLHLFDEQKFYNEVIPTLKGEKGNLEKECLNFLKYHVAGGIAHLSELAINELVQVHLTHFFEISKSFDATFKEHYEFQKLSNHEEQENYLGALEGYYEFCAFFEYYVFKTCADFFPHIPLGKGGGARNFTINENYHNSNFTRRWIFFIWNIA